MAESKDAIKEDAVNEEDLLKTQAAQETKEPKSAPKKQRKSTKSAKKPKDDTLQETDAAAGDETKAEKPKAGRVRKDAAEEPAEMSTGEEPDTEENAGEESGAAQEPAEKTSEERLNALIAKGKKAGKLTVKDLEGMDQWGWNRKK